MQVFKQELHKGREISAEEKSTLKVAGYFISF
jgi:hypothetical protein